MFKISDALCLNNIRDKTGRIPVINSAFTEHSVSVGMLSLLLAHIIKLLHHIMHYIQGRVIMCTNQALANVDLFNPVYVKAYETDNVCLCNLLECECKVNTCIILTEIPTHYLFTLL